MNPERAAALLSRPIEPLSVEYDDQIGPVIGGQVLTLESIPYSVGRFIAEGDEALVYELINLRTGERDEVIKICRHQPASSKYAEWAVPFRFEGNRLSELSDVELNTAKLVKIGQNYVKVQRYFVGAGQIDWGARRSVLALRAELAELPIADALSKIDSLIEFHGRRGQLFESRGLIFVRHEQWEQAQEALEEAVRLYSGEGSSLKLLAGLILGDVYEQLYQAHGSVGATTMTLDLGDGKKLTQKVFADPTAAAMDDALQDRTAVILLEILHEQPCFVPALTRLALDFMDYQPMMSKALAMRAQAIDPEDERAGKILEYLTDVPAQPVSAPPEHETQAAADVRDSRAPSEMPDGVRRRLEEFDAHYKPELGVPKTPEGRRNAFDLCMRSGRYERALEVAEEWDALREGQIDSQCARIDALAALKRHDEAQLIGDRLIAQFPTDGQVSFSLSNLYFARDDHASALKYALLAIYGRGASIRDCSLIISRCYRSLGNREKAVAFAKKAFSDDFANVTNLLNYIYVLRAKDEGATPEEQALSDQLIASAYVDNPNNQAVRMTYAQMLARTGRMEEAAEELKTILRYDPVHPVAAEFLEAIEQDSSQQNHGPGNA